MKLKGIIFDIDGTLTDTLPICITAFKEATRICTGRCISDEDVTREFGADEEGIMAALAPEKPTKGLETYISIYKQMCMESLPHLNGLDRLLTTLRSSSIKLAVVTGKGKPSTDITLEILGISDFFDHIVYGSPTGGIKSESINEVVESWGFDKSEVAYVGDFESDIKASLDAGVIPVLATWINKSDFRCDNCHIFADVDSFIDWAR